MSKLRLKVIDENGQYVESVLWTIIKNVFFLNRLINVTCYYHFNKPYKYI